MILLIDNYDSFTYNLFHYLGELGEPVTVVRNDRISARRGSRHCVPIPSFFPPVPAIPDKAGICLELIRIAAGTIPILGVCLGHQAIGQAFGGRIVRAPNTDAREALANPSHAGRACSATLRMVFSATRYHSLVVDRATLPDMLEITAETEDGVIMGVAHKRFAVHGVQFHPESIASEHGHKLLRNFLELAHAAGPACHDIFTPGFCSPAEAYGSGRDISTTSKPPPP